MTIQINGTGSVVHQEEQILLYFSSDNIWSYNIWISFHEVMEQIREALTLMISTADWDEKAMRALAELFFLGLLLAFLNEDVNNLFKRSKHWFSV